jgi:hypothetical protein
MNDAKLRPARLAARAYPRDETYFAAADTAARRFACRRPAASAPARAARFSILSPQLFRQTVDDCANFLIAGKAFVIRKPTLDLSDLLWREHEVPILVVAHGAIS